MILALKVKDSFSSIFTNTNKKMVKKNRKNSFKCFPQPKVHDESFISKAVFLFKVNVQYVLLWLSTYLEKSRQIWKALLAELLTHHLFLPKMEYLLISAVQTQLLLGICCNASES